MSIYEEINKKLDELHERINPKNLEWLEDVEKTLSLFMRFEKLKDFATALEKVERAIEGDKTKERELNRLRWLLKNLKKGEPDFLIENLTREGDKIARRNEDLRQAIEKEFFRILEQVRLGNRDKVIGMLIRNFAVKEIPVPNELIEAIKPKYDISLFKAFMYAFLSGFVRSEDKKGGEKNEG